MNAVPLTLTEANDLITKEHRHHKPVIGLKFAIGCEENGQLLGAAITGRPVARAVNARTTAEITRLVSTGEKNVCSFLYSACARAAKAMGYLKIQTYILESEPGTSLKASGFVFDGYTSGGDWNGGKRQGRRTDQPMCRKQRWIRNLV